MSKIVLATTLLTLAAFAIITTGMSESTDRPSEQKGQGEDQFYVMERGEITIDPSDFDDNDYAEVYKVIRTYPARSDADILMKQFDVNHWSDDPDNDGFYLHADEVHIPIPYHDAFRGQSAWWKNAFDSRTADASFTFDDDPNGGINSSKDLYIRSDGRKMYVQQKNPNGSGDQAVLQYTLSTLWDITTAHYDGKFHSVESEDSGTKGLFFKDDGTKMFTTGTINDNVYQYSLSTPWDISTASYDNTSVNVGPEASYPNSLFFQNDGSKMFVLGGDTDNNTVYQYSLATAWDLSIVDYDNKSLDASSEDTLMSGLAFKTDGTVMFLYGNNNNKVYRYTLSTAWDLSTASYESDEDADVGGATGDGYGIFFQSNGKRMFLIEDDNTPRISQLILSEAWRTSTAKLEEGALNVSGEATSPNDVEFRPDGLRIYIVGDDNDNVAQYDLSIAWDLNTATFDTSFDVSGEDGIPEGIRFKDDGTKMYMLGFDQENVHQYSLSTAWDVGSASYDSKFLDISSEESWPSGIAFGDGGAKLYVIGDEKDRVFQYSLSTLWDISAASYDGISLDIAEQDTDPESVEVKDDGGKIYVLGGQTHKVHQYSMSGWDISTATYDKISFDIYDQEGIPKGITITDNGGRMFLIGSIAESVQPYNISTAWDLSTTSYRFDQFEVRLHIGYQAPSSSGSPWASDKQQRFKYTMYTMKPFIRS